MNVNPHDYDSIIVYASGGKDSAACYLNLLDLGIDPKRIECWHHEIDGKEGSRLMDWPVTPDYCRKFAEHFGSPIYYSWKEGGFEREMLRENQRTAPIHFETPDGLQTVGGQRGKESTRRMFPQVSADLSVRWCSAYLKIDVGAAALRNQDRFLNQRVLTISGERAEESTARANYAVFEPDRTDNRDGVNRVRHVDRWRPIHDWTEQQVWDIMRAYQINPHPAYILGWGRVSCMKCIFGNEHQWASANVVDPSGVQVVADYETDFGKTIHRVKSIMERINKGVPYEMDEEVIRLALSTEYYAPMTVEDWVLPKGAFGDLTGPC